MPTLSPLSRLAPRLLGLGDHLSHSLSSFATSRANTSSRRCQHCFDAAKQGERNSPGLPASQRRRDRMSFRTREGQLLWYLNPPRPCPFDGSAICLVPSPTAAPFISYPCTARSGYPSSPFSDYVLWSRYPGTVHSGRPHHRIAYPRLEHLLSLGRS